VLKAVVFLYVFHIVYTGVFTGVMISAILLKINYIRGLYVMNKLVKEIEQLKKEKNAVILAHYYVNDEVQEIADYIGDSYYLAKVAREVDAKTIVFCGVSFMGESAKILNPNKTVLMPDMSADCPMAHMAQVEKIEEMRENYEGNVFSCMGCRSFLSPWKDENGEYKWEGRFNQGAVSINLPQIGLVM